jgi:hypothetical protein
MDTTLRSQFGKAIILLSSVQDSSVPRTGHYGYNNTAIAPKCYLAIGLTSLCCFSDVAHQYRDVNCFHATLFNVYQRQPSGDWWPLFTSRLQKLRYF